MKKERNAFLLLSATELLVFLSLTLLMPLYEKLPYYFNTFGSMLARTEDNFLIYQVIKIIICILMMTVPTIFIGMTVPFASRVCVKRINILGKSIGTVFSVNTLGNLFGAVIGGLVLIPQVGLKKTLEIFILLTGILGVGLYSIAIKSYGMKRYLLFLVLPLSSIFLYLASSDWNGNIFNTGFYRVSERIAKSYQQYKSNALRTSEVLFHEDGLDVSVVVARNKLSGNLTLKVNGKAEAGTGLDMETQLLLSHIPLLLHKTPKDVLMVGYGSGISSGAALKHRVERLDIVEISNSVINASHSFDDLNGSPLDDYRTRLFVADAREFLKLRPNAIYDIIISQPSNPWIAGMGNLFTKEFFAEVDRHLKIKGMMVQWVQLYDTNDQILSTILNSFSSVFAHVTVWNQNRDIVIIGSQYPQSLDEDIIQSRTQKTSIQRDLSYSLPAGNIAGLLEFLSGQMLSSANFKIHFPGTGKLNFDYFPYLEFEAPKAFYANSEPTRFLTLDERFKERKNSKLLIVNYLKDRKLAESEYSNLIAMFSNRIGKNEKAISQILSYQFWTNGGKNSACALSQMIKNGNLALYAAKELWEEKMAMGTSSKDEWDEYISFQFQLLLETASVFSDPDFKAINAARQKYRMLFNE